MDRVSLPFLLIATPAARALAARELHTVAVLAFTAILQKRSVEVAHLQVRHRKNAFAVSSRIGRYGDMILEIDAGDPKLADRVILEADLRRAEMQSAGRVREIRGRPHR